MFGLVSVQWRSPHELQTAAVSTIKGVWGGVNMSWPVRAVVWDKKYTKSTSSHHTEKMWQAEKSPIPAEIRLRTTYWRPSFTVRTLIILCTSTCLSNGSCDPPSLNLTGRSEPFHSPVHSGKLSTGAGCNTLGFFLNPKNMFLVSQASKLKSRGGQIRSSRRGSMPGFVSDQEENTVEVGPPGEGLSTW